MNEARDKKIIITSIIGIVANVFLAAFKALIGMLSHSIAITMDAVNNISDAGSSLITIIGTKLAGKEPNKKHPFGYGRIEYMSALIISFLVLYAGITAFIESVKAIFNPATPEYSVVSIVIVAVAVVVKFVLGRYVKAVGKKVDSDALVSSGTDATMDSIISLSTLVAAAIYLIFDISLESYLGAIISIFIIKSGIEMLLENISRILGESVDAERAKEIKDTILQFPDVSGAYDLVLHDYGPNAYQGSVHVEVPDTFTANELDNLLRSITVEVYKKHNVVLSAIGVYSVNTQDEEIIRIREDITRTVLSNEYIVQLHGFYLDKKAMEIRFDIVISFDAVNRGEVYTNVVGQIKEKYPDYSLMVAMDTDFLKK